MGCNGIDAVHGRLPAVRKPIQASGYDRRFDEATHGVPVKGDMLQAA